MIQVNNVRKVFNAGRSNEFVAVEGVTLTVQAGGITALKGPSGSGKTTLLTFFGCMARPSAGRIMLHQTEITSLPERFLTEIRRRTFGFIFQHFNLIKGISALDNVMLPAYPTGEKHSKLLERAMGLLETLGMVRNAHSKTEWLSGGEAQRVAIARALINDPEVVIADEPTAHLDTKLSQELMEILRKLKASGKTIIVASHDPIVFESGMVDSVVTMRDGRIVEGAGQ